MIVLIYIHYSMKLFKLNYSIQLLIVLSIIYRYLFLLSITIIATTMPWKSNDSFYQPQ